MDDVCIYSKGTIPGVAGDEDAKFIATNNAENAARVDMMCKAFC